MAEGIKRWSCNPRVSVTIPGAGNLKKLLILLKIDGLTQTTVFPHIVSAETSILF